MAVSAQTIIRDAQAVLVDLAGTSYPASALVRYLNAGQVMIAVNRPAQTATTQTFVPAAGADQVLPAEALALIDIPRNTAGARLAIRRVDQAKLDAAVPGWYGMAGSAVIQHFCYDLTKPRQFLLYPPALTSASVQMTVSLYPVNVAAPSGDGRSFSTVSGVIGLTDQWQEALLQYVLHRALAEDLSDAKNAALSAAHLAKFNALVGIALPASKAVLAKE
jgi:hypothetical protein